MERATCVFCFEPRGLVRTGCACRGECAVLHVQCLVRAIIASGSQEAWIRCRLCHQEFTGPLSCALAQSRAGLAASCECEEFCAEVHAIDALCESQKPRVAEARARALLERTVSGTEQARIVTLRLAIALMQQRAHAEAERLVLSVLANGERSSSSGSSLTAQAMTMLARIMHATSRFHEAESIWRSLPLQEPSAAIITRVLMCETLNARRTLAAPELAAVLSDARRVFGESHAVTRMAAAICIP
jgi:hypothetical protein